MSKVVIAYTECLTWYRYILFSSCVGLIAASRLSYSLRITYLLYFLAAKTSFQTGALFNSAVLQCRITRPVSGSGAPTTERWWLDVSYLKVASACLDFDIPLLSAVPRGRSRISYHTIPHHTILYHTIIPYHTILYHITPYHITPNHTVR